MKPNKEKAKITSNLTGEDVVMQFDKDSVVHLMDILIRQYSDPEFAGLREYSCNAYESHVLAGNNAPIEIKLPSKLSPTLEIQDYGVGLNKQDIKEVYSLYGASTKRGTNDVGGMLGLGSKSALAYADQFTVVGVKDGIRTTVSVSKNDEGVGVMKILDESETNEPNGVLISIPAKQYNQFEQKAKNFFRFWPKGSVLVNGEEPKRFEGTKITDRIYASKKLEDSFIVQGNIAYPFPKDDYGVKGGNIVCYVNIGTVDFPPNRESLEYTKRTKDTIKGLVDEYNIGREKIVAQAVNQAKDRWEALKIFNEYKYLHVDSVQYKGEKIATYLKKIPTDPNDIEYSWILTFHNSYYYGRQRLTDRHEGIVVKDAFQDKLFITEFDNKTFTTLMKERIESYLNEQGIAWRRADVVILQNCTLENEHWINPKQKIPWPEIKKKSKGEKVEKSSAVFYDVIEYKKGSDKLNNDQKTTRYKNSEDINKKKPIFYSDSQDLRGTRLGAGSEKVKKLAHFYDEFTMVFFFPKRTAKFKKLFPEAIEYESEITSQTKKWWSTLTAIEKELHYWQPNHYFKYAIESLIPNRSKIEDKSLRDLVANYKKKQEVKSDPRAKNQLMNTLYSKEGILTNQGTAPTLEKQEDAILKQYPFLGATSYSGAVPGSHYLEYVNAVYQCKEKTK